MSRRMVAESWQHRSGGTVSMYPRVFASAWLQPLFTRPLRPPSSSPAPQGIVLGKHSGRNALSSRLRSLGYELSQSELDDVFKWVVLCRESTYHAFSHHIRGWCCRVTLAFYRLCGGPHMSCGGASFDWVLRAAGQTGDSPCRVRSLSWVAWRNTFGGVSAKACLACRRCVAVTAVPAPPRCPLPRRFKALADKKKGITDEDILALMSDELHQPKIIWDLLDLQVCRRGLALAG